MLFLILRDEIQNDKYFMKKLLNFIPYLLVIVLGIFAMLPLFHSGFFPTHDDTQPSRIFEMLKALKLGMFPVRWVPDLGYGFGYPLFNFYAPFAFYVGSIFYLLTNNAILSIKILIGLSIMISAVSMYLLCKEFFGKLAGIIGAVFYVFATYRAVQIYVRGDLAEYFAYGLIPFLFLTIYKLYLSFKSKNLFNSWIYVSLSAVFYSLVIITHNLSGIIVSIFILLFILFLFFKNPSKKSAIFFISSLILGVILSAFYSIPALSEIKFTNVLGQLTGGADYSKNFVCPIQFWYSPWGYGGSVAGCVDGLSFMIGKLHIIFSLLSFVLALMLIKKFKNISLIIIFSFITFLISLFIQTDYSLFLWRAIPVLKFLQYPWRFLMISSLFSSICAAGLFALIFKLNTKFKIINYLLFVVVITSVIYLQFKFFRPETYLNLTDSDYISQQALNLKISKISDEYLPKEFRIQNSEFRITNSLFIKNSNVTLLEKVGSLPHLSFEILTKNNTNVILNLAYFPFWHVKIDGKVVSIKNYQGRIMVLVPKGEHSINIYYEVTNLEKIANLISISGFIIIFLGIIIIKTKYGEKNS